MSKAWREFKWEILADKLNRRADVQLTLIEGAIERYRDTLNTGKDNSDFKDRNDRQEDRRGPRGR